MQQARSPVNEEMPVEVRISRTLLYGDLYVPGGATGIVVFAHGSGSSRQSPRNRYVAGVLRKSGLATLLFDLLTIEEEAEDLIKGNLRFNIKFLSQRLVGVTDWVLGNRDTGNLKIGYFGASTGAAAALVAAAERPDAVHAVVSRGGRPDLAGSALPRVKAPTLLIVGGHDHPVIDLNKQALARLQVEKDLIVIPGATHLFEEPGALEEVAQFAANWLKKYLE